MIIKLFKTFYIIIFEGNITSASIKGIMVTLIDGRIEDQNVRHF